MEAFSRQFGLMIAYLLPGFIGLVGLAPLIPTVAEWLHAAARGDAGLGPPVYALLAAMATGMVVSSVRWLLIDHIHGWMGIKAPPLDFAAMDGRLHAFNYIVEGNYRYYQFNSNGLVAVAWAYSVHRILQTSRLLGPGTDLGVLILCAVLFAASRDALAKYYRRSSGLLGHVAEKDPSGDVMTNGFHHEAGNGAHKADFGDEDSGEGGESAEAWGTQEAGG